MGYPDLSTKSPAPKGRRKAIKGGFKEVMGECWVQVSLELRIAYDFKFFMSCCSIICIDMRLYAFLNVFDACLIVF